MIEIRLVEPSVDSLVYESFDKIDYRDAFEITFSSDTFADISQFATAYFISQPAWLRLISMKNTNKEMLIKGINESGFKVGGKVGSWVIQDKCVNEIVFGESMGFMDYRFSMRLDKSESDCVQVSTVVKINSLMGKFYFMLVKLLHKKFVIKSLRNVIENLNRS